MRPISAALFAVAVGLAAPAAAHDVLNAVAVDDYGARLAGSASGDEAGDGAEELFARAAMVAEIIELLNADLAAHSGSHGMLGDVMVAELKKAGIDLVLAADSQHYAPRLEPFERYLERAPDGPRAARARFTLITTRFREEVARDPFSVDPVEWPRLASRAGESQDFLARHPEFGDAAEREEIEFVAAITAYRAYLAAPDDDGRAEFTGRARVLLEHFTRAYPDSLRAGATEFLLERLAQTGDDGR
jgi:hypothetical protein